MAKQHKKLITVLKIFFSAVLLYFIFTKINLEEVLETFKRIDPLYLLVAIIFFILSKTIAALRLNLYFHQLKVTLTQISNLKASSANGYIW